MTLFENVRHGTATPKAHSHMVLKDKRRPWLHTVRICAHGAHVKVGTAKNRRTICALMLDEMAIRKHIQFADGEYHSYVDVGNGQQDDSAPMAKYALVLMVVSRLDTF